MCAHDIPEGASLDELADFLRAAARAVDVIQARWLVALGEFDRAQAWVTDGALSAVDWLVTHARMARGTAFEKLRVAAELRRRPVVRTALLDGRISYSAARAITRAAGAWPAVDEALVEVAIAGTVVDVERMVRRYLQLAEQDRRPREPGEGRGLRITARPDGTTQLVVVLDDGDAAELLARIDRIASAARSTDRSAPAPEAPSVPAGRADALVELARTATGAPLPAAERYMVHAVVDLGTTTMLDGRPLDPAAAAAIRCDCSTVTHTVDPAGAPLALGRLQRTWNASQRRAVAVRDGGRCRWPGCERRTVDVHHVLPWEDGGSTDVANGVLLCPRHHTLTHAGWHTTGSANDELTWHDPRSGRPIGSSRPDRPVVARLTALAAAAPHH
ncbi:MAG TPA: DUF222 domain-containing protein [Acidimicrobiales bacterium]|nr:DUF222 domain-containing protein [Acidimicrobiales bacterium]